MRGRSKDKSTFMQMTPEEKETGLNAAYRRRSQRNVKQRMSAHQYTDMQTILNARERNK